MALQEGIQVRCHGRDAFDRSQSLEALLVVRREGSDVLICEAY